MALLPPALDLVKPLADEPDLLHQVAGLLDQGSHLVTRGGSDVFCALGSARGQGAALPFGRDELILQSVDAGRDVGAQMGAKGLDRASEPGHFGTQVGTKGLDRSQHADSGVLGQAAAWRSGGGLRRIDNSFSAAVKDLLLCAAILGQVSDFA